MRTVRSISCTGTPSMPAFSLFTFTRKSVFKVVSSLLTYIVPSVFLIRSSTRNDKARRRVEVFTEYAYGDGGFHGRALLKVFHFDLGIGIILKGHAQFIYQFAFLEGGVFSTVQKSARSCSCHFAESHYSKCAGCRAPHWWRNFQIGYFSDSFLYIACHFIGSLQAGAQGRFDIYQEHWFSEAGNTLKPTTGTSASEPTNMPSAISSVVMGRAMA